MRNTKGQAAMEFLMTYGWAILAAIIAIGVLSYFGVFSPGKYVSDSAALNPPFYANSWQFSATTGNISIEVKNNGGEDYAVNYFNITGAKAGSTARSCNAANATTAGATTIAAGSSGIFSVNCSLGGYATSNFKGDIIISYNRTGSSLALVSTGSVAGKIQT